MGIAFSVAVLGCSPAASRSPAERNAARVTGPERAKEPQKPAFDLRAALDREASGLTKHPVDAGPWQADVLAASTPVVTRANDVWTVLVDLGTQGKVQCFVYEKLLDPGHTVGQFLKLLDPNKMQVTRIAVTDVRVIRETPVLFAEGSYIAKTPNGLGAGLLKIAMQAHETHPVACVHDELGYRRTFASVLESLAESLRGLPEPAEARFVDISRDDVGAAVVGFSFGRMRSVLAGGSEWFEQTAQFLPRSATELMIEDTAEVQTIDASGTLVAGRWSEAVGGELTSNVVLSRKPTGKYAYQGTIQSKPVAGEFGVRSKGGLDSVIRSTRVRAQAVQKMQRKEAFDSTMEVYLPGLDPTKPLQKRFKGLGAGALAVSILDRTIVEKLSSEGLIESWETELNGIKITGRRIFTKGSLFVDGPVLTKGPAFTKGAL